MGRSGMKRKGRAPAEGGHPAGERVRAARPGGSEHFTRSPRIRGVRGCRRTGSSPSSSYSVVAIGIVALIIARPDRSGEGAPGVQRSGGSAASPNTSSRSPMAMKCPGLSTGCCRPDRHPVGHCPVDRIRHQAIVQALPYAGRRRSIVFNVERPASIKRKTVRHRPRGQWAKPCASIPQMSRTLDSNPGWGGGSVICRS